ncbi:AAA family ATPase [Bosea sp. ASV33]|uniref:AAA family ATPase n=1 Tax=Bosea sp. ASV33 TaxID=2795106 RepID=UPI0018ECC1FB|nr:AAA family ATPase [Bosea sp. ASV33]
MAAILLISALAFVAGMDLGAHGQGAAPQTSPDVDGKAAAPNSVAPPQVTTLLLQPPVPSPLRLHQPATAEFMIEFEHGDPATARREANRLVGELSLVTDGGAILPAFLTVTKVAPSDSQRSFRAFGAVGFTPDDRSTSAFVGLSLAPSRLLILASKDGSLKSNFVPVEIGSSIRALIAGGLAATSVVLAIGWFVVRRNRYRRILEAERSLAYGERPVQIDRELRPFYEVPPPEPPEALLEALRMGRAILVLGSGASAQAGVPSARVLINRLINRFDTRLPSGFAEALNSRSTDFSRSMDALMGVLHREEMASALKDILSHADPDLTFHRMLASLPWKSVVDLTWDHVAQPVFTREMAAQKGEWAVATLDESAELLTSIRANKRTFLKPLGELDRTASLSLSMDEFRRNLTRWPEFTRQVGLQFQTHTVLFVGAGADTIEQFLQAIGSDAVRTPSRHFSLVPGGPDNEVFRSTLGRFGVELLPYPVDGAHSQVSRFVMRVVERHKATQQYRSPEPATFDRELASSRIRRLTLHNVGHFEALELNFRDEPIEGEAGLPWTVIFGPNGCGKSTILRAIGLALVGNETTAPMGRLLRLGERDGAIELSFGNQEFRTQLTRDRDAVVVKSHQTTPVQAGLSLVLGFPALRGGPSTNPKGVAAVERSKPAPADLMPLVNVEVEKRLVGFKQWMINVLEQAGRGDRNAMAMKQLLDEIIRDIVPGRFRKFAPLDVTYVIKVKLDDADTASPTDVPFDDISQGMASIFNWLGILVQRMYDFYPDSPASQKEPAVVLIDEIDAHLHPDWQRKLVEMTKRLFPAVQVIATSHSPLLAGALRKEELCVLGQDARSGVVRVQTIQADFFGQNSQQILTSFVFGLKSDRNPETERAIERYFDLFERRQRTQAEQGELRALGAELERVGYGSVLTGEAEVKAIEPEWSEVQIEALNKHFAKADERPGSTGGTV